MRCSRAAAARLIASCLACGGIAPALCGGAISIGCASQPPSPFFNDERFLVLGVDPDAETDELARQLEANGFRIVLRLRGRNFSALGAAGPDGLPAKVRVVTARGIALALDFHPGDFAQTASRYALIAPPSRDTHDADGDGFEEVFVRVLPEAGDAPCIQVYRVRDSGFVDAVAGIAVGATSGGDTDPAWKEPNFCAEPADDTKSKPVSPSPDVAAPPAADAGSPVTR